VQHESGRPLDLKLRGAAYRVRVARVGAHRFRVGIEAGGVGAPPTWSSTGSTEHTGQITVNGTRFRLVTGTHGPIHLVEVDGVTHRVSRDEGGVVRSPAPALVVATPLAVGDEVEAGAPLLVLESMKMETVLRAPFRARLKECAVSVGSQVGDRRAAAAAGAARRDAEAETTRARPRRRAGAARRAPARSRRASGPARGLQDLRSLLLGFDVDPHDERRVLAGYLAARAGPSREAAGRWPRRSTCSVFADLSELSRNRPAGEDRRGQPRAQRPRVLPHLPAEPRRRAGRAAGGVPDQARQGARALRRHLPGALAGAGSRRVPDLPGPAARAADAAVVAALLRGGCASRRRRGAARAAGLALERLVAATQVRFPVVADLGPRVVFAWFGQPLLRRNRARVYADIRAHLRYLDAHPDAPDRAERIAAMVRSTEPLVRLLGQRLGPGGRTTRSCWRC
jgi:biotin carboxyl carrier protein